MKKTLLSLSAALVMVAGLTEFTGSSAQAVGAVQAKACTPYAGTVKTGTAVVGPGTATKGDKTTFTVQVITSGNATPEGAIRVRVRKNGVIKREVTRTYPGSSTDGKINVVFPSIGPAGSLIVYARYLPSRCSIYVTSFGHDSLTVSP